MTRRTGNGAIVTEDVLSINPADAKKKKISTGDKVRLFSARGEVALHAIVTDEVKPGILYTTFHFPEAMVNNVTGPGCDADTLCPEYKVVAVDVERISPSTGKRSSRTRCWPRGKRESPRGGVYKNLHEFQNHRRYGRKRIDAMIGRFPTGTPRRDSPNPFPDIECQENSLRAPDLAESK